MVEYCAFKYCTPLVVYVCYFILEIVFNSIFDMQRRHSDGRLLEPGKQFFREKSNNNGGC